ncbi:MAG: hypothetical protein EXQ94_14115 [Alphaproteobacteria bacterium]|nr:hypothetical protein [Alphaproteobacteria bacterium]
MTNPNPSPATRFRPGRSGNPRGRIAGARDRLGRKFITALASDFEQYGGAAIEQLREDDPGAYVRIVASLLPKDLTVRAEVSGPSTETHWNLDGLLKARDRIRAQLDKERQEHWDVEHTGTPILSALSE